MYFTYIIQNSKTNRRYIGSTEDLNRRLAEHNSGKAASTRYAKGLWKIVYFEQFETRLESLNREKVIKSYKGGRELVKLLGLRD